MNLSAIHVKIFIGFWQQGELKMHLNHSHLWKEAKLFQNQGFVETQFQGREYIGKFIESSLFYNQVKEQEQELRRQLREYCPKLNVDKQVIYLFPQIFLS